MFNGGFRGRRANDNTGSINPQVKYLQDKSPQPSIVSWSILGSDDLALVPAGGQVVIVNGTGFTTGTAVTLNGQTISPVTILSPTQLTFTSPALSGGSYTLIVYNTSGAAAILVPGLTYSSIPTYSTAAGSIGTFYETTAVNTSVVATSDSALTYTLASGSLPSGATLFANGVITGTAPVTSGSATYTFSITATDVELQDVTRTFTLTINTDVVTWVTPASGATITLDGSAYSQALAATDAAGYSVSYTANTLPTGLTLSAGTISGTPTVESTVNTLLTATAATSGRSAANTITWIVALADAFFKYTSLLISGNGAVVTTTFASDASINNAPMTVAGDTRAQNFNPFSEGFYSVLFPATGSYLTGTTTFNPANQTRAWTVECWFYPLATTLACFFCIGNGGAYGNGLVLQWSSTAGKFKISQANGGSEVVAVVSTGTYTTGQWYHIAATNDTAGVRRLFINGILDGTQTYTAGGLSSGTTFVVNGVYDNRGMGVDGGNFYISNLRLIPDQTVYTANFVPATSSLTSVSGTNLLLCKTYRFIDVSPNTFAVTVAGSPVISPNNPFGSVAPTSVTVPGINNYSIYFDGTGDYLNTPANAAFAFGTGEFTIECWIFLSVLGTYRRIWWFSDDNDNTNVNASNQIQFGGASQSAITGSTLVANTWYHLAYVRSSGSGKLYLDGAQVGSTTANSYNSVLRSIYIGATNTGGNPWSGYISNLRVVNGQAVYTGPFALSTTALTAVAPTGTVAYSTYFDGTGDYLSLGYSPNLAFSTNDFTIEGWFYHSAAQATNSGIFSYYVSNYFILHNNASSYANLLTVWVDPYSAGLRILTGTTTLSQGTWYHFAITRASGVWKLWLNGVQEGTSYTNTADPVPSAAPLRIGYGNSAGFTGYISNFRITNGQALYTTTFTPSTTPLTTTSQGATAATVSLLTNQSAGFVDNSRFAQAITRFGDATASIVNPFYANATVYTSLLTAQNNTVVDNGILTTPIVVTGDARPVRASPFVTTTTQALTGIEGSAYFDGNGDNLFVPASGALDGFGTLPFTMECWIYLTALKGYQGIISKPGAADANGIVLILETNNTLSAYAGNSGTWSVAMTGAVTPTINQWHHIALTRDAVNVWRLFYDGALTNSTTNSISINNYPYPVYIGKYPYFPSYVATQDFSGYISNVRIVKGTALYTSAFFPGYAPLTNVTNTQLLTLQTRGAHNTSTFVDNSTNGNLITRAGNVTNGTFSPYGNSWSVYFNGASYISTPAGLATAMGGGFATNIISIEMFVYPTNLNNGSDVNSFIGAYQAVAANGRWHFYHPRSATSTTTLGFVYTTGTGSEVGLVTTATPLTQNQWNHIAVTIDATTSTNATVTIFANGALVQAWTAQNMSTQTTYYSSPNIGGPNSSYVSQFAGYMSNLRILKGAFAYTGAYTVPVNVLQNTSATVLNACQSNRFIDASANNYTLTPSGTTVTVQKFSPFGSVVVTPYYSGLFNGTTDYLSIPATVSLQLTADFTMEAWIYLTTINSYNMVIASDNGASSDYMGVRATELAIQNISYTTWSYTFSTGVWYHIAVTRSSNTLRAFVNGNQLTLSTGSATNSSQYLQSGLSVLIGKYGNGFHFPGYISNARVVKGLALYTGAFSVPTAPLALTQTAGTNIVAMSGIPTNGNSVYFNGTTDYLTLPYTVLPTGTENFTVELWFYKTSAWSTGNQQILGPSNTSSAFQLVILTSAGDIRVSTYAVAPILTYSYSTLSIGTWYHIAVTRSGNNFAMYFNGVSVATATSSSSFAIPTAAYIGYDPGAPGNYVGGYISNLRVTKGIALYTGAFTTPTSPLGLTQTSGTNIVAMTGVPTNGNSVFFNGSTDYLTVPQGSAAQTVLSGGDFTMECWFYIVSLPATGTNPALFSCTTVSNGFVLRVDGTQMGWIIPGVAGYAWGPTINLRTWYHVAVCRVGTVVTGYLNGTQYTFASTNRTADAGKVLEIGNDSSQSVCFLNGYISNARIVKGTALYTTSFTPSTTPLSYVSNTVLLTCQATTFVDTGGGQTITRVGNPTISQTQSPFGYSPSLLTCQPPRTTVIADNSLNNNAITIFGSARASRTTSPFGYSPALLTLQNNTFVDAALDNLTITAATTTVKPLAVSPFTPTTSASLVYSTSQFSGSMYFDGTGDYLTVPTSNIFSFSGAFTFEVWLYPTAFSSYKGIWGNTNTINSTGFHVGLNASGNIFIYSNSSFVSTSNNAMTLNTWNHVVVVRNNGVVYTYINGLVSSNTWTTSTAFTNAACNIGTNPGPGTEYYFGYMSDLRITNGAALYTANFYPGATPATPAATIGTSTYSSALLVNGTAGGIVDSTRSAGLETIGTAQTMQFSPFNGTYYSNYFATTSDYISAPIASFPSGGTTWTIEGWFNASTVAGTVGFFCSPDLLECKYSGTTFTLAYRNNPASPGWTNYTATVTLTAATWYHIAVSVAAGSMRLFINGIQYGTTATVAAGAWGGSGSNSMIIGANDNYIFGSIDSTLAGNVSNFRITNTAVYTSNFVPSTTPLTAISGTTLLTCQSNRFVDNSSNAYTITATGSPKVQASNPWQVNTGVSFYVPGGGNTASLNSPTSITFAGAFTLEAWVYLTASGRHALFGFSGGSAYSTQWGWTIWDGSTWVSGDTTNTTVKGVSFCLSPVNGYGGNMVYSSQYPTLFTWAHIAVVRDSSNNWRFYMNGVQGTTLNGNAYIGATGQFPANNGPTGSITLPLTFGSWDGFVGGGNSAYMSAGFNGYVADLRITNGYARYSTAFTPPTAAVKAQ